MNRLLVREVNSLRSRLVKAGIASSRAIEFAGGIVTALLGISIYVYIAIKDAAIQTGQETSAQTMTIVFLMLVVPGVVVAIGTYFHVVLHKRWGLALLFVGGLCNLIFVGLNAGFAFAYGQDAWGQWAVRGDLAVTMLTLATALINALVSNDSS